MAESDLSQGARLQAWAELIRLPLVFVVAADTLAGAIIAGACWTALSDVGPLIVSSAAFWAAAGAIGDWYTCKGDLVRRPQRPIPSRRIGRWHALSVGVVLLATGVTLAGAPGPLTTSRIALLLAAFILLGRILLRHVPAALVIEVLYRPFNFLMGLVVVPLAVSPVHGGLRLYILVCVGLYAITLVLLEEHEIHSYRARSLAAIAAPALLAGLGIAAMPVLFQAAGPSLIGTLWAGLMLAYTGYRLVQAVLTPSGTTVNNALRAVALGGIMLAAAATAFTHHPWGSLLVAVMLAPAWWSMRYLDEQRAAGFSPRGDATAKSDTQRAEPRAG